jgi:cytidylate kinase
VGPRWCPWRGPQAYSDGGFPMSVITISRGSFSGGKILAECLARRLGYRCIDRDIIVERAAAYGVSQNELRDALEKPPSFLDRFKHKKYLYLTLIQAALTEEVRTGKAIYHGMAGHLLLQGGHPILRTRIIAPLELRVQMLQERLKYSRSAAIAYIEKVDEDRRKWTQFLYGVDWGEPSLYDIVLNLEHLTIEEACHIIASMVIERSFELTPEWQQRMDDFALACRVRADLAINASTSDLEVEVVAHQGAVSIKGRLSTMAQIDEVRRVAAAASGVISLNLDQLAPPVRA